LDQQCHQKDGVRTTARDNSAGDDAGSNAEFDVMEPGRDGRRPWVVSHLATPAPPADAEAAAITERVEAARRGLVVAGWGSPHEAVDVAAGLGWPLPE